MKNENATETVLAARLLLEFYLKRDKSTEVERVLNEIVSVAQDKVGALILYGDIRRLQGTKEGLESTKKSYQSAIDANPKDPRGYRALARFMAANGNLKEAIVGLEQVLLLVPDDVATQKELIVLLLENGQDRDAENRLAALLKARPEDAEALAAKASVMLRKDQYSNALELLNTAVEKNPGIIEPLLKRVVLHLIMGDTDKARTDLVSARQLTSKPEQLRIIGTFYVKLHDDEKAQEIFQDILNRNGNYGPVMFDLGQMYIRNKDWNQFDAIMAQAKKAFPQNAGFRLMEADAWKTRGVQDKRLEALAEAFKVSQDRPILYQYLLGLLENSQTDKALKIVKEYSSKPGFVTVMMAMEARTMAQKNQKAQADEMFQKALKDAIPEELGVILDQMEGSYGLAESIKKLENWKSIRPAEWQFLFRMADWYAKSKVKENLDKAVDMLIQARDLASKPESKAEVNAMLGMIYYQRGKEGDKDNAEKCYLEALKVLPEDIRCLNNLAYLYTEIGQAKKALPYAEKAVKIERYNSDILDTYGWTLAKLNQMEKAEDALLRAVKMESSTAVVRYHLGYVYENMSRKDSARKQYQMCLEMIQKDDPLYDTVQEAMKRVQGTPASRSSS